MKLAVVGSREFTNYNELSGYIDFIRRERDIDTIVSGGARGADRLAKRYARKTGLGYKEYPADWNGPLKKGAGFARNTTIAQNCDIVCAFWDGKSHGTKDVIEKAEKEGREMYVYFF